MLALRRSVLRGMLLTVRILLWLWLVRRFRVGRLRVWLLLLVRELCKGVGMAFISAIEIVSER